MGYNRVKVWIRARFEISLIRVRIWMIRVKVKARFRIKVRFSSMIMINWIRFTINQSGFVSGFG